MWYCYNCIIKFCESWNDIYSPTYDKKLRDNYRALGIDADKYCVKCRAKKEVKDAKAITMKNGKPATQGVCPSCGTKMFRIGKA